MLHIDTIQVVAAATALLILGRAGIYWRYALLRNRDRKRLSRKINRRPAKESDAEVGSRNGEPDN